MGLSTVCPSGIVEDTHTHTLLASLLCLLELTLDTFVPLTLLNATRTAEVEAVTTSSDRAWLQPVASHRTTTDSEYCVVYLANPFSYEGATKDIIHSVFLTYLYSLSCALTYMHSPFTSMHIHFHIQYMHSPLTCIYSFSTHIQVYSLTLCTYFKLTCMYFFACIYFVGGIHHFH